MVAIIRRSSARALGLVEPFYRPTSLLDEVERMARDILASRPVTTISTSLTPKMDMYENKQGLVIKAEFPGIKKGDLDVNLEDGLLTIKAEKKAEDTTFYSCARHCSQYSRGISHPFHIGPEQISATLKAGLLEIKLPPPRLKRSRASTPKSRCGNTLVARGSR